MKAAVRADPSCKSCEGNTLLKLPEAARKRKQIVFTRLKKEFVRSEPAKKKKNRRKGKKGLRRELQREDFPEIKELTEDPGVHGIFIFTQVLAEKNLYLVWPSRKAKEDRIDIRKRKGKM